MDVITITGVPSRILYELLQVNKTIEIELEVEIPNDESTQLTSFLSRIENIGSGTITLAAPFQNGHIVSVRPGAQVQLRFGGSGALYTCNTHLLECHERLSVIIVKRPDRVFKTQLRKWVRIEACIPVEYRMAGYQVDFYHANTFDISGGGICMLTSHPIDPNTALELKLQKTKQVINAIGVVTHCSPLPRRHTKYRIGLYFQNISEADRERIIEYLFVKQRELIRTRIKTE